MKRVILSLCFLISVCALWPRTMHAQQQSFHFIWPTDSVTVIDCGVMDYNVTLYNDNVWIHNPTDDTLEYDMSSGFLGDFFLLPLSTPMGLVVAPHDSGQMVIYMYTYGSQIDPTTSQYTGGEEYSVTDRQDSTKHWTVEVLNKTTVYPNPYYDTIYSDQIAISAYQNQITMTGLYLIISDTTTGGYDYDVPADSMVFFNRQDSDVIIKNAFIPKATHFDIARYSDPNLQFPYTLHRGDHLTLYLSYSNTPDTLGYINSFYGPDSVLVIDTFYNDYVVLVTDTTVNLSKANPTGRSPKSEPKNAVRSLPATATTPVVISNNPVVSSTLISLPDASSASMRIVNLLGVEVARFSGTQWNWPARSTTGEPLPAGSYILDAHGVTFAGTPFHHTEPLIITR